MTMPSGATAPRPLFWSVRRELWEHPALYMAPLIAAAILLFGFLVSTIRLPQRRLALLALDPERQAAAVAMPYHIAAFAIIATGLIVALFYCLGALHNERRDRSILFFKSMPVSDLTTVLSKALIPLVALPLILFTLIVASDVIMLTVTAAVLAANGVLIATPATQAPMFEMDMSLLYGLAVLALWYAPVFGWLLMVSCWARRAPFLWAVLPPMGLAIVERVAFGSSLVGDELGRRLSGGFGQAFASGNSGRHLFGQPMQIDPVRFLGSPDLWFGLVAAAVFFAACVWLRRNREPV